MKRKAIIILCCIAFFTTAAGFETSGVVRFVYDGDSVMLTNGEKVRYLGVDAPEIGYDGDKNQYKALESKNYNAFLVSGKRVRLEFDLQRSDRYGRQLAYVFRPDGKMVNALLVESGMAKVYFHQPKNKYFALLLQCQRKAIAKKIGIWNKPEADEEAYYVGSLKSFRFHRPGCKYAKKIKHINRVSFKDRAAAYWEGFSPCSRCVP